MPRIAMRTHLIWNFWMFRDCAALRWRMKCVRSHVHGSILRNHNNVIKHVNADKYSKMIVFHWIMFRVRTNNVPWMQTLFFYCLFSTQFGGSILSAVDSSIFVQRFDDDKMFSMRLSVSFRSEITRFDSLRLWQWLLLPLVVECTRGVCCCGRAFHVSIFSTYHKQE